MLTLSSSCQRSSGPCDIMSCWPSLLPDQSKSNSQQGLLKALAVVLAVATKEVSIVVVDDTACQFISAQPVAASPLVLVAATEVSVVVVVDTTHRFISAQLVTPPLGVVAAVATLCVVVTVGQGDTCYLAQVSPEGGGTSLSSSTR